MRRLSVNLEKIDSDALDEATRLSGRNVTETLKRALHLYVYVSQVIAQGGDVHVRERGEEPERIKLL